MKAYSSRYLYARLECCEIFFTIVDCELCVGAFELDSGRILLNHEILLNVMRNLDI